MSVKYKDDEQIKYYVGLIHGDINKSHIVHSRGDYDTIMFGVDKKYADNYCREDSFKVQYAFTDKQGNIVDDYILHGIIGDIYYFDEDVYIIKFITKDWLDMMRFREVVN